MRREEYRKSGPTLEIDVKPSEQRARGQQPGRAHARGFTALTLIAAGLAASAASAAGAPAPGAASPVPTSQAEFGGQCPEALAEGQHVMTNCSVTWTDKDGKLFCFSTEAAKKSFLSNPTEKLERAREFMAASSVESTETAMQ